MKWIFGVVVMLLFGCETLPNYNRSSLVLVSAKIIDLSYVRQLQQLDNEFIIGAAWQARLGSVTTLMGREHSLNPTIELVMTSRPSSDELLHIYVLGERLSNGELKVIHWDYIKSGLCVPLEVATKYNLVSSIEKLREKREVSWSSACGW
jgi:hypothetical protein